VRDLEKGEMDADLLALQKLFEQTQESKAKVRLSERNVVELVCKLQEINLLDADLLHTVSGKEYITQVSVKHYLNHLTPSLQPSRLEISV
jgi:hypothetical protein